MESKQTMFGSAYEEFQPSTTWEQNPKFDTLIVHLPDFKREQLKVQLTSTRKLRIQGERPLRKDKWIRFRKEFPIAANYDTDEISAKFEGGALRIKHPKIIMPDQAEAGAPKETLKPQKSESDSSQAQKKGDEKTASQDVKPPGARYDQLKNGQEQASQEADPSKINSMEKQPSEKASGVGSASDDVAKTASRQSSEKKSTEDRFAEDGKSITGAATVGKDKNLGAAAAAEKAEKEAAGSSNGIGDKYRVEEIKQALRCVMMQMNQHRKFMNMIVAFLLVLGVWIYVRKGIGSIGKCNN